MSKKTSFTTKLNLDLKDKLLNDLKKQGFKISQPPYTVFSAQKPGITCSLYKSGSLVVQGGKIQEFIEFYLEPEILKTVAFTYPETTIDLTAKIGSDEAGKGDFFGPLCTVAVYANVSGIKKFLKLGVSDSKKFSDTKIIKLAENLKKEKSIYHSAVCLFPETYNGLYHRFKNLNALLAWCHATAISEVVDKTGCKNVLVDQFSSDLVLENAIKRKNLKLQLVQKTRAEADLVVAAASILARNYFLEGLNKLEKEFKIKLPKGASDLVIKAGRKIISQYGKTILPKIAKTHFKTYQAVLS